VTGQLAGAGNGNDARLFRNDEHHGIGGFADANGRAVAGAQLVADARALRQRQDAGAGHDPGAADHHSAIVQGGVGLKDILQQGGGNLAINADAGFDHVLQTGFLFKHDQRAHTAAAQVGQALDDLIHHTGFLALILVIFVQHGAAAHLLQGFAQFRLEENHQHHRTIGQDVHQQPVQGRQAQEIADANNHQQQNKALQHSAAAGLPGEHDQFINDERNDDNVDNIR